MEQKKKMKFKMIDLDKFDNEKREELKEVIEMADVLGTAIHGHLVLASELPYGLAVCATGMAKAMAALKSMASLAGVNIDNLYEAQLATYEEGFNEIAKEIRKGR